MALKEVLVLLLRILFSYPISFVSLFLRQPKKDVTREIVLVTGAGHGMGRLQAIEFAKLGATVVVADVNEANNEETADEIRERGGRVYAYTCDLSKRENVTELAAEIREEVGDVTILVNNAGVINVADICSLTEEKIKRTFNVNVLAHFWTIREFLPAMKRKNHGFIIELASQGGLGGSAYMTDYCASKFAVVGLCESLSRELRWENISGIHIMCVCPFFVQTGFVRNARSNIGKIYQPEEVVSEIMKGFHRNDAFVVLPPTRRLNMFVRSLLPHQASEAIFDYMRPECDLVDMKKSS